MTSISQLVFADEPPPSYQLECRSPRYLGGIHNHCQGSPPRFIPASSLSCGAGPLLLPSRSGIGSPCGTYSVRSCSCLNLGRNPPGLAYSAGTMEEWTGLAELGIFWGERRNSGLQASNL